ncbi:hypothetical protein QT17_07315 [Thermus sp. 2.9]|nr:hypothetical protein QT17_07315 [Thermus sp. 2.9]
MLAHEARLQGHVDPPAPGLLPGLAQKEHLRVGRGVLRGLHPVVGPIKPLSRHQHRPHGHLPLGQGFLRLLQGKPHEPLPLPRGKKPVDLHHPLPLRPHGPEALEFLGHPFFRQEVHQALAAIGHNQVVPRLRAAEARGKGKPGGGRDEEERPPLAASRVAFR